MASHCLKTLSANSTPLVAFFIVKDHGDNQHYERDLEISGDVAGSI